MNNRGSSLESSKKITDYFTRNRANSAGSPATTATSPYASLKRRDSQKCAEPGAVRKSSRISGKTQKNEPNMMVSSKRVRSPDIVSTRSKNAMGGPRQRKRQRKFDSDSDVEMSDYAVIYVKTPVRMSSETTENNLGACKKV